MNVDNLTVFEKKQLLQFFGYYMSQDTRKEIMRQLPAAYNSWCGSEIVRVHGKDQDGVYNRPKFK